MVGYHTTSVRAVGRVHVLLLSLLIISLCAPVYGQTSSAGTVAGQVTDPTNAVVAGATVTLTDNTTNTSRTATTNESGRFVFSNVTGGTYDITVAKSGFSTAKLTGQEVSVGNVTSANVQLKVGAATETVRSE